MRRRKRETKTFCYINCLKVFLAHIIFILVCIYTKITHDDRKAKILFPLTYSTITLLYIEQVWYSKDSSKKTTKMSCFKMIEMKFKLNLRLFKETYAINNCNCLSKMCYLPKLLYLHTHTGFLIEVSMVPCIKFLIYLYALIYI